MSAYLCGASLVCAQGENRAVNLACPQPPVWQTSRILDESRELPYRRAFSDDRLILAQLYALIDHHLHHTLQDAGWPRNTLRRIPIFLGSTVYVIADREARYAQAPDLQPRYTLTEITRHLQDTYANPHIYNLATSCTSSAHAIAQAARLIENGLCEQALVIGFESYNRMTFEHFQALGLLAEHTDSPGIILGEALACVALSGTPHRDYHCAIRAIHHHTDHRNLTHSSAEGLAALLDPILAQAPELASVKIHATGGATDQMEQDILRARLPNLAQTAWKPLTGHTLGATGALETALTLQHPPASGHHLHYHLGFGGSNIAWILDYETPA